MAKYISFCKFTAQGTKNLKSVPEMVKQSKAGLEKMGIDVVGVWFTFGQYDIIALFDAPDDSAAGTVALTAIARGNWTTETVRALSEDEFAKIVQCL
jgi:uncharacterized protein with GYD domain